MAPEGFNVLHTEHAFPAAAYRVRRRVRAASAETASSRRSSRSVQRRLGRGSRESLVRAEADLHAVGVPAPALLRRRDLHF